MNQSSPRPVLNITAAILSILVACVLIFSAITHVGNPYAFASAIKAYRLVGSEIALATAFTLPFLEMSIAAVLLFQPRHRATALLFAGALFLAFVSAQVTALVRGLDVACGCFGTDAGGIGARSIAIAATSLAASGAGLVLTKARHLTPAPERTRASGHSMSQ